jgi:hypothetical protein
MNARLRLAHRPDRDHRTTPPLLRSGNSLSLWPHSLGYWQVRIGLRALSRPSNANPKASETSLPEGKPARISASDRFSSSISRPAWLLFP